MENVELNEQKEQQHQQQQSVWETLYQQSNTKCKQIKNIVLRTLLSVYHMEK